MQLERLSYFLGPLKNSSQKKSEDSRNSNSHGSFIETPEDEKKSKKKKKKKSKSAEVFADEEKRPILNDSPSEKESVKKGRQEFSVAQNFLFLSSMYVFGLFCVLH